MILRASNLAAWALALALALCALGGAARACLAPVAFVALLASAVEAAGYVRRGCTEAP